MATPFTTVYDRALIVIDDYHLDEVAQTAYQAFLKFWEGVLIFSVPYFDKCQQSLTYNTTTQTFDSDLTEKEINILAEIMVTSWFEGKVQTVSQFEQKLSNREFKMFSEAQNLKVKSDYLDKLREKYNQDIMQYSLSKNNFAKIFNITLT